MNIRLKNESLVRCQASKININQDMLEMNVMDQMKKKMKAMETTIGNLTQENQKLRMKVKILETKATKITSLKNDREVSENTVDGACCVDKIQEMKIRMKLMLQGFQNYLIENIAKLKLENKMYKQQVESLQKKNENAVEETKNDPSHLESSLEDKCEDLLGLSNDSGTPTNKKDFSKNPEIQALHQLLHQPSFLLSPSHLENLVLHSESQ